jgi:glucan 1,3-beta-glucosidase
MGFFRALVLSALVLEAVCMQGRIPAVENIVASILANSTDYVHFQGKSTHSTTISNSTEASSSLSKRQSAYWYENIAHQGISAFGPSGYQVYRNVKDFGAKGTLNTCIFRPAAMLT